MVRDQVHNFGKLAILLLRQLGTMHGDDIRGRWYLHPKPLLPFRAGSASGACEKKTKPRPLKGVNGRTSGGGSRVKCCLQAPPKSSVDPVRLSGPSASRLVSIRCRRYDASGARETAIPCVASAGPPIRAATRMACAVSMRRNRLREERLWQPIARALGPTAEWLHGRWCDII